MSRELFWLTLTLYGRGGIARLLLVALVLSAYAAIDELTQPWFRRTADLEDWMVDSVGIVIALSVAEVSAAARAGTARG